MVHHHAVHRLCRSLVAGQEHADRFSFDTRRFPLLLGWRCG
jgi:hypothetical protein